MPLLADLCKVQGLEQMLPVNFKTTKKIQFHADFASIFVILMLQSKKKPQNS